MTFPRWFVRWVNRHGADWSEAEFEAWANDVTPVFTKSVFKALENLDWRVVRLKPSDDASPDPQEVVAELTAADLKGVH